MNPSPSLWRILAAVTGLGLALTGGGCKNPFIARHRVLVDAIAAPGATKPNGASYRIVMKQSVSTAPQNQIVAVKACVDAALSGLGMYPAPANTAPDLFIEVGYGQDNTPRVDPAARETYLQISARSNPRQAVDRANGDEIWDVRVAVLGIAGRMESAMPVLAMVATDYFATDTKLEAKVEVPQNSPSITALRETAIKSLESEPTPGGSASAPGTAAGSGPVIPPMAK